MSFNKELINGIVNGRITFTTNSRDECLDLQSYIIENYTKNECEKLVVNIHSVRSLWDLFISPHFYQLSHIDCNLENTPIINYKDLCGGED